ncbi:MAG: nucleoside phosphorylase [Anaerolineaceae bacterium]|jgi:uridine phosphorylase|nr:MAG: nucleoside phosphorylase [Anaerolineaceae bacterium]
MEKQHHIDLKSGDVAETVFLPGDVHRAKFIADLFDDAELVAHKRQYITYTGTYKGIKVSVTSTGIGCPALAIAVEELINVGAKNFIRIGTCGALQKQVRLGSVIIATGAVRGDGTSREYFPLEYPAVADFDTLEALIEAAHERNVKPHVGIIRAHDAFYAESILAGGDYLLKDKPWIDSGVLSTENESSTLFTLCTVRKCRSGTILIPVGHHLFPEEMITTEQLTEAIKLESLIALDAAVKLKKKFG